MNIVLRCPESRILVVGSHADEVSMASAGSVSIAALQQQFPQVMLFDIMFCGCVIRSDGITCVIGVVMCDVAVSLVLRRCRL